MMTLIHQRTEGKSLSCRPINVLALSDSFNPAGKNTLQVAVDMESFWGSANGRSNVLQSVDWDSRRVMGKHFSRELLWRLESVPCRGCPLLRSWLVVPALGKTLF